ncbi:hypothetical protein [Streptomyces yaizuensis]|uniref:HEAT repeat domain-containing protein n=1 Tax=Streptomyces yaizuensis TaxID=2989713 RepID=A0ABQ5NXR4_9ACTN|nr:hypothetical protein [Streptomyces sp. YSPA8]GLF95149.1 HEAT repeat domain-containing protein [Streptomyces sp. YSPA8]
MGTNPARETGSLRLVLRPPAGELEVTEFALENDWLRLQEGWVDPQGKLEYRITWECDPEIRFHYTEDALAGCRYVQFSAPSEPAFAAQLETARSGLPWWVLSELTEAVDVAEEDEQRGRALVRMAVGSPADNDDVFERISDGLQSESKVVREFSILASFYSMYPSLRPLLRSVAEGDPSPDVRHHARTFLSALDNLGVSDPQ